MIRHFYVEYERNELSKRKGNTHDFSDIFVVWISWEKEILLKNLRAKFYSVLRKEKSL